MARTPTAPIGDRDTLNAAAARLVDDMVDCYITWRESEAELAGAYRCWTQSPFHEKGARYALFTAWLAQEQSAAVSYEVAAAEVELWLRRTRRSGSAAVRASRPFLDERR